MQADVFYQSPSQQALILELIDADSWSNLAAAEKRSLEQQGFEAKLGTIAYGFGREQALERIYIGQGRGTAALAVAKAVLALPAGCYQFQSEVEASVHLIWSLAQYRFDTYKTIAEPRRILCLGPEALAAIIDEARAIFLVRDLINRPANDLGPKGLALQMQQLAERYGAEFKQYTGEALIAENFPAIYAVGAAAAEAPRLLCLEYGDPSWPKISLVGKGVCFDSGGLDLKPAQAMRLMKKDMGGAAQVIGLAQWLMAKALPIRLQVLVPAVENALGSRAYRPGDVLTMRNGLRVEIDNTDAEGRLVMADALVLACEQKPELLVDFATLTGAARVAVGTEIGAMFTPDEDLAAALYPLSKQLADPIWRLPLHQDYAKLLDSSVADLCNSADTPYAGAITAALFLERFVCKETPWLHFDIMAWNLRSKPGRPEGGEAMAMRTVAHYLIKKYQLY